MSTQEKLEEILQGFRNYYAESGTHGEPSYDHFATKTAILLLIDSAKREERERLISKLPKKIEEYPVKWVSVDDPRHEWASSETHGLTPRDAGYNCAINHMLTQLEQSEKEIN